jgi:two-component system chemotaxis response regulator CheY
MRRSLVVDDARVVRKVARKIFEDLGFIVEEASDGQDAVAKVRLNPPEVMLLDWNMPVMNGIECLAAVRQLPLPVQPKIIMCTTENDFDKITRALETGANEYIMKPFDSDILRSKLEQVGVL